jgi:hypothetical protein
MWSVFGDESADESKQRVFVVAGVIGPEDLWKNLEQSWKSRTGSIPFHAVDCQTDHGDYASFSHNENQALYKDLTTLLAQSRLAGHGIAIDLAAKRRVFPEAPDEGFRRPSARNEGLGC